MLLTVSSVLNDDALAETIEAMDHLTWKDGAETAGRSAKAAKRNLQADLTRARGQELHETLLKAISAHPVVQAAARPNKFSRLILSQTTGGGHYGEHTDNAIMGRGTGRLRTDLSFTLFLSPPDSYDGGELVVDMPGYTQSLKPDAGDLVLYPSSSIHQVAPVTRGARLACVGWIESMVRDAFCRETLFDLENLRASMRRTYPTGARELLTLDKSIANLMRLWAET